MASVALFLEKKSLESCIIVQLWTLSSLYHLCSLTADPRQVSITRKQISCRRRKPMAKVPDGLAMICLTYLLK